MKKTCSSVFAAFWFASFSNSRSIVAWKRSTWKCPHKVFLCLCLKKRVWCNDTMFALRCDGLWATKLCGDATYMLPGNTSASKRIQHITHWHIMVLPSYLNNVLKKKPMQLLNNFVLPYFYPRDLCTIIQRGTTHWSHVILILLYFFIY